MSHGRQRHRCRRSPRHHPAAPLAHPSRQWQPLCRARPTAPTPPHRPSGATSTTGPGMLWSVQPFRSVPVSVRPGCNGGCLQRHASLGRGCLRRSNRTWLNDACRRRKNAGASQERAGRPPGRRCSPLLEWGKAANFQLPPREPSLFLPSGTRAFRRGRDWTRPGASLQRPSGDRGEDGEGQVLLTTRSAYRGASAPARPSGRTSGLLGSGLFAPNTFWDPLNRHLGRSVLPRLVAAEADLLGEDGPTRGVVR
jgi:hypothetical protein